MSNVGLAKSARTLSTGSRLGVLKVYKISPDFPDGLLEHRVKRLYDAVIPDAGLLVCHIDENVKGEWQQPRGYLRVFGCPETAGIVVTGMEDVSVFRVTKKPPNAAWWADLCTTKIGALYTA